MHHNLDLDYDFKISWLVAWMFARVYSCTAVEQYCKFFFFFFVLPCFPVMLHLWLLSPDPGSAGVFLVLKESSSLILSLLTHSLTAGMFFSKIVGSYNAECREVAVVRNWHNVTKKKNKTLYFLNFLSSIIWSSVWYRYWRSLLGFWCRELHFH